MDEQSDEDRITIHLRPDFAVFVASTLEILRDTLDDALGDDSNSVEKANVAAIDVLCHQIAVALKEQEGDERINAIVERIIDRYK